MPILEAVEVVLAVALVVEELLEEMVVLES
jgi:hypothetical protein